MSEGIVIVGGGLAAARVAKAYREAGGTDPLRVLGSEPEYPYSRPPLSKRFLRGEIEADGTLVEQPGFYAEHDCRCDLETEVVSVRDREVELASGEHVPFDRLVVATGASARSLEVPGADLGGVFTLRTVADASAIRERARSARRAFVVGSNFIGLEVAASLTHLGVRVTLCDRGTELFRALECPPFSTFLDELYRSHGVELMYEDEIDEIRGDGDVSSVLTRGGIEREADLVIAGIGVVPNTAVVAGTGVEVADGIVVDERFESSMPGIYAVGDVARFFDPVFDRSRRIEHWSNAAYQGAELGKILAGLPGGYDTVSSFFSEIFGAGIRFFGDATGHDTLVAHGDFAEGEAVYCFTAEGTLVAALAMGPGDEENERIRELIRTGGPAEAFAL
jgi:3-phenylpropionate/trans-cinnamate dioxygenase ferredoxin reductase subunit